jgi:hypothetical protein
MMAFTFAVVTLAVTALMIYAFLRSGHVERRP